MNKEEFTIAHAEICNKKRSGKTSKRRCPANRRACGRDLYEFLVKHKISLDIRYNQKKFGKNNKANE